jgi:hypothetical protein
MRTDIRVGPVSAGSIGSLQRLCVPVHNTGQTFTKGRGILSGRPGGQSRTYPVIMETVLPGDSAVLPVNARRLGTGAVPCSVRLRSSC